MLMYLQVLKFAIEQVNLNYLKSVLHWHNTFLL